MRSVSIVGAGQIPAKLDGSRPAGGLAASALKLALADAAHPLLQALFVSSMYCEYNAAELATLTGGIPGVEARCIAPDGGGGAALHMAVQAVAAGAYDIVALVGVDSVLKRAPAASPDESGQGLSCIELDALIMRRYLYEYGWQRNDFAPFVINARRNALANRCAAVRTRLEVQQYIDADVDADPLTILDSAPTCSGAAAVVLCPSNAAQGLARSAVCVAASAVGRDALALHDRADILRLHAAHEATSAAYAQAGLGPQDIDIFELHDSSTIMAALSLEAAGFAEQGDGARLGISGAIAAGGRIPISTCGGLLARGDAGAASGVYQAVEAVLQLRAEAAGNQVDGARVALIQSMTGSGACAATHILHV